MDVVRIAIGCTAPLPSGVGADGRWDPPGVDGVQVLFTGLHDPNADDWSSVPEDADDDPATLERDLARVGWDRVDCYVADIAEYRPIAADAHARADRVLLLVGDWNIGGRLLWQARGVVDAVLCDHAGVETVERIGHAAIPTLIWGVRPEWPYVDPAAERDIDVLFIGSTNAAIHARRNAWLLRLGALADHANVVIRSRLYGPEYRAHMARAKLVFNHSVRGEANIRSYEGAVAGACVLNERGNPELPHVFTPDTDFATYDSEDLADVVRSLLQHDDRRLAIAAAGQQAVRAHTIDAHMTQRVESIRDWLAGDPPRAQRTPRSWAGLVEAQWLLGASARAWTSAGRVLAAAGGSALDVDRLVARGGMLLAA
ncbi:MAG: glycosyltransferase family 1 protein, partial [Thermoleophilia bacterium]|nr:glycosyltransferase family 1 protein [Thermoleophilia bacterium]